MKGLVSTIAIRPQTSALRGFHHGNEADAEQQGFLCGVDLPLLGHEEVSRCLAPIVAMMLNMVSKKVDFPLRPVP